MRERIIGIDAGGTMTKAALFDATGREFACVRQPNRMLFPKPNHTERDAESMWQAAATAVRSLLESTGTSSSDVAAVSVTGYGSGIYLVDRDGRTVRPGVVSTDGRAAAIVDGWRRDGRVARNEPRIQQRIWSGQAISLMAWFQEHEPEIVDRTSSVLMCKDFLRARLCGDRSTDPTDAGIAGFIDVTTATYAEAMLDDLGLARWRTKLPPICPSIDVAGAITHEAAAATGLKQGTAVVRGVVDVAGSALASGVTRPDQLSMVAGTFSINSTLHRSPRSSVMPFLQMPYPIEGWLLATEGSATSASNFEWFCRNILDGEAARAVSSGRSIYDVCNDLVADALARDNDILFLPYLFGSPEGAPAGFLGMQAANTLGDLIRAIFEGVAFAHRTDIERLLSGPDAARPQSIRLAGGASRSRIWGQLFADVLGLPIEVTDGSELGARGAAISAAVAVGLHDSVQQAVDSMVRVVDRFDPEDGRHALYDRKFMRFRETTKALGALFAGR
ncbi:carbohydrate kinase [Bradyrhizobium sp. Y36]|uniref:FGGY-family carbohydrate kinase n=1 Tax=Bradyrhizobium sp. Y36 TaxID=2035447 RepID=UPI000BE7B002|nr:FGGY-family carbohydrate kinase [Bradyrhizobium sp. Y36]PDT82268.1 carbohydrate kinase [Bradyrhizobium sp. Y36]